MLDLSNVARSFGETRAVDGIDLTVREGHTTVLIGPSGCGKSTLLRMMNGLVRPDSGEVRWRGQPITPDNLSEIRHRQGYVIQEGGLFPHLTARQNVTLLVRYMGWDDDRIAERVDELAELTRLPTGLLNRYPRQISGGQRQRVSLMRALMPDPEVLLLDEPLGALDPMIRSELQSDLRSIFSDLNKTVVMVTHDLAEADYFAGTMVLMRRGKIVQSGSMIDLIERPSDTFVLRFVEAQRSVHMP